jgi:hypothetical protein
MDNAPRFNSVPPPALDAAQTWLRLLAVHQHETQNFTLNLETLTDDELTALRGVSPEFLDCVPVMLPAVKSKHAAELKGIVVYLTHLNALQAAAWQRTLAKYQAEEDRINAWMQRKSNGH